MSVETSVYNVNSQDYGMPFSMPGKALVLRAKHIGDLGTLIVTEGWILNDWVYNTQQNSQDNSQQHKAMEISVRLGYQS